MLDFIINNLPVLVAGIGIISIVSFYLFYGGKRTIVVTGATVTSRFSGTSPNKSNIPKSGIPTRVGLSTMEYPH